MIPHRTHRPDSNRDEIVKALEEHLDGNAVNLGNVGEGVPDIAFPHKIWIPILMEKLREQLLSGDEYFWITDWFEFKSPKGKYTPKEQAFMDRFPGLVVTLRSVEDVIKEFGDAPDVSAKTGDNWKYGWDG